MNSVNSGPQLHPTHCAICGQNAPSDTLYEANFSPQDFSADVFSARRLPDRIHYRLVKCRDCGLVRSDPVIDADELARLYERSTFDYGEEVGALQQTYGRYLGRLEKHGGKKGALLEVGCGNGFFLEQARRQGFETVAGVEPSRAACELASPEIRPHLVCDVMREGIFPPHSFDAVCLFQVFDHIPEPGAMLRECARVLRPGGLILLLNHDITALSARVLGEKSPIIDLEHTYLYSPHTLRKIAAQNGFEIVENGAVKNLYSLFYLARLVPFPKAIKGRILRFLQRAPLGKKQFWVPLGNQYLIARKKSDQ